MNWLERLVRKYYPKFGNLLYGRKFDNYRIAKTIRLETTIMVREVLIVLDIIFDVDNELLITAFISTEEGRSVPENYSEYSFNPNTPLITIIYQLSELLSSNSKLNNIAHEAAIAIIELIPNKNLGKIK